MSRSSETTNQFELLGYPDQAFSNSYYTAQARPGIGVCVATLSRGTMVQFFPWRNPDDPSDTGHGRYSRFIVDKTSQVAAEKGGLFDKWPFFHTDNSELLIIKCMVEEGLNQVEQFNELNPRGATDPATGKVVE
jgi:hypothetical protein